MTSQTEVEPEHLEAIIEGALGNLHQLQHERVHDRLPKWGRMVVNDAATALEKALAALSPGPEVGEGESSCGVLEQPETGVASQLLGGEQRFFLSTDGDSHWYLVPEANRAEWQAWADLDPDDERAWEPPAYAKPLGGGPQGITFTNPQGLL